MRYAPLSHGGSHNRLFPQTSCTQQPISYIVYSFVFFCVFCVFLCIFRFFVFFCVLCVMWCNVMWCMLIFVLSRHLRLSHQTRAALLPTFFQALAWACLNDLSINFGTLPITCPSALTRVLLIKLLSTGHSLWPPCIWLLLELLTHVTANPLTCV